MDITDEGIASADMGAEFGQSFDCFGMIDVGQEFEQKGEFAGFGGLGHKIDAVEVVSEDSFYSEIAEIIARGVQEGETGDIEGFELSEGSEEEGTGAAGGIEDSELGE